MNRGERNARARLSLRIMQTPAPPEVRDDSSLPAAIRAALDRIPYLPLPCAARDALYRIVRCAPASAPGRRFRLSVEYLMHELRCSRATAKRRLAALAGWIGREQTKRGARRHGWRAAWTWLTEQALEALGLLQRGSLPGHDPKPCSKGKPAFRRARRIPADLVPLAARIGASRVVWLMSEARKAGRRLQDLQAGALQADCPASFVLRALRGAAQHSSPAPAGRTHDTADETRAALAQRDAHRAALPLARLREQAAALRTHVRSAIR